MKLIRCNPEKYGAGCAGEPATLPNGKPYVVGRTPTAINRKGGWIVTCSKCGLTTRITAHEWSRTPELTFSELKALGLSEFVTRDLGITDDQAAELEAAGVSFEWLHHAAQELPQPPQS